VQLAGETDYGSGRRHDHRSVQAAIIGRTGSFEKRDLNVHIALSGELLGEHHAFTAGNILSGFIGITRWWSIR
jgi:hypothetical protein